jgi:hypothetical protein
MIHSQEETSSPTSTEGIMECLICSKNPAEVDEEDSIIAVDHFLYRDRHALRNVFVEIFEKCRLPHDDFPELFLLCKSERFCCRCLGIFEDVSRMLSEISKLQLLVQNRVESVGKLIADSKPVDGQNINNKRPKRARDLWNKLRQTIINSNI